MHGSGLRVLYDHQIFEEQDFGGISRYFAELVANLRAVDTEVAVIRSDNQHLLCLEEMRRRVQPSKRVLDEWFGGFDFRGKRRLFEFMRKIRGEPSDRELNRWHSLQRIEHGDFHLFHPTYYDPYFIAALGNRPFVLTVHDMIHELFPGDFPPGDPTSRRKRELCHRAARIIAVSQSTKSDLTDHLDVDPEKIDVVYHGVKINPEDATDPFVARLSRKILLFVGKRSGYKNFRFFVTSIADLLRQDRELQLVCTGETFSAQERALFRRLSITSSVMHISATDRQLALLYRRATAFVFPSLYEGFGMPILEAFACRCPVVLCDTAAMREVAGEAGLFFPPNSCSDLVAAVSRILTDHALRDELIERGSQRAARFSWQNTAAETAAVYQRAMHSASRG